MVQLSMWPPLHPLAAHIMLLLTTCEVSQTRAEASAPSVEKKAQLTA